MAHVYFHIDLNAFFANAECLLDPSLKGKPLVVSGNTRRSVISTASYEARSFGIHSGQPIGEAVILCKSLTIVEPHFYWYKELSADFINIIKSYTPILEQASIDECYADMSDVIKKYERPLDLAWEIQKRILNELGLQCSIGIGPNLFLAKMASDMKKPMGITVLRIREVQQKLWPLAIEEMRGIGKKTIPYMQDLNIKTIGDLANYQDIDKLRSIFGKNTDCMLKKANGYDDREIIAEWDSKTIGVSETLLEDVTDYDELKGLIRVLSRKLSSRLREQKKIALALNVRLKFYNFKNIDRSINVGIPTWKSDDIFTKAMYVFNENWDSEPIRLIGISAVHLKSAEYENSQLDLFSQIQANKEETISVLKDLNHELGGFKLKRASDLLEK